MLLLTGATGFIGRAVIQRLNEADAPVRVLLSPSRVSPKLPAGVAVEAALASPTDPRGVRAALVGVETVVHLAGEEAQVGRSSRLSADVRGTRELAEAAFEAGAKRFIYLSQVGADRSSAYPLMRARAQAEEHIRGCGVPYTILRSGAVFGEGDRFTTSIAMMMAAAPLVFPIPGDGSTLLQPVWTQDLATAIAWMLDEPATVGETYEIGGPEFLTLSQVIQLIMHATGMTRILLPMRPPYLRAAIRLMEILLPRPPLTSFWVDYLAANRTAELDALPRMIGLRPSRMEARLDYLASRNWGWELLTSQFSASVGSA